MGVDAPQKIPKVVIVTEENSSDSPVGPSDALELGNYTLASPVEIAHHLKNIAQQGHMVTVFSNKGRTFILTRILYTVCYLTDRATLRTLCWTIGYLSVVGIFLLPVFVH